MTDETAKPIAAETLTPMARAWLERFTPESWEGFPGYEPEVATAIRQALTTIDAAQREVAELREKYGETSTLYQDEMAAHAHLSDQIEVERARVAALEAQHEQLRQMILTQGEAIHEQEERVEALEATLAKVPHLGYGAQFNYVVDAPGFQKHDERQCAELGGQCALAGLLGKKP